MGLISEIFGEFKNKFFEIKLNNIYKQLLSHYSIYQNYLKHDTIICFDDSFNKLYKTFDKLLKEVGGKSKHIELKDNIIKLYTMIEKHNEKIRYIEEKIKKYDLNLSKQDCLFKCDTMFFSDCDKIITSLKNYENRSKDFRIFINNYELVKNNRLEYLNECEQVLFEIKDDLNKTIIIDETKYKYYQNYLEIKKVLDNKLTSSDEIISLLKSYVDRLLMLKEQILSHNTNINLIENQIIKAENFINNCIKKPSINNLNLVNIFTDLLNNIDKFSIKIGRIADFYDRVYQIDKDKNIILEQFDLFTKIKMLFENFDNMFYDLDEKEDKNLKLNLLKEKLNSFNVKYYNIDNFNSIDNKIVEHNKRFINNHASDVIFDDVNGLKLDYDQRKVILTDEVAELVVAGAGSGKTLTICGKVKYLLNVLKVPADKILLLSYSNASAKDLSTKILKINENLSVSTFHALGLKILNKYANEKQTINDQTMEKYIYSYISTGMYNRNTAALNLLSYYALFLSNIENFERKYETEGDLYEDLKCNNFDTLKKQLINLSTNKEKKQTIKRENVKSYEELVIANYYFINGIRYDYEKPYQECKTSSSQYRQYLPDFYLRDYNIYHEHYGIDKNGRATQFTKELEEKYLESIKWKRELHSKLNTICLETYSYQFKDSTIFKVIDDNLKKLNIKKQPLNINQIKKVFDSIQNNKNFISVIKLISTFINLYKSIYRDNSRFQILKEHDYKNIYLNQRKDIFLDICKDIYDYYIDEIRSDNKIDFDDMIIMASEKLKFLDDFKYDYIIVDEFQDISQSRIKLLQKLVTHGKSKLFAVGDDWQSIYRFTGCDLNIFTDFNKYFNKSTISFISNTYRCPKEVHDIVEPFITRNKNQIRKKLKTEISIKNPIRIYYYDQSKLDKFYEIIKDIYKIKRDAEILILGRNNSDINFLQTNSQDSVFYPNGSLLLTKYPSLKIKYRTVHASKGLESEYVILISADDLRNGFPNQIEDDILLELVLSKNDHYPFAEERRLWYVALTRSKNVTYIIADEKNPSIFVKEIESKCYVRHTHSNNNNNSNSINCPHCKTGKLISRINPKNNKSFYGCSNFPYCNYTNNFVNAVKLNKRCPICGDFLLVCNGKYGKFYRCTNRECNYTCDIDYIDIEFN